MLVLPRHVLSLCQERCQYIPNFANADTLYWLLLRGNFLSFSVADQATQVDPAGLVAQIFWQPFANHILKLALDELYGAWFLLLE